MMSEKIKEIVSSILNMTSNDTLKWERTSSPLMFMSKTIRPYAICISKSNDSSTNNPVITFCVMDEHGNDIVRLNKSEEDVDYKNLRNLYECVESKDEVTTQFIDKFLQELRVEAKQAM